MINYIIGEINEAVIKENEWLIYKVASNFSKECRDDLYQVGSIGLINAYKNYDSSYGVKFSTYAYSHILGEMKKYRRENRGVKISREIQYLSSRLDRLIELLSQKYNRMPTIYELSAELDIDEWKVIEALNARNAVKSLDEPLNTDGKEITVMDTICTEEIIDYAELDELLSTLSSDERKIIEERYFLDKSQSEVAISTGYSQAKVSREESRILTKLRSYYN